MENAKYHDRFGPDGFPTENALWFFLKLCPTIPLNCGQETTLLDNYYSLAVRDTICLD